MNGGDHVTVFLGLGSNIGDRLSFLRQAVAHLQDVGLMLRATSSVYETEPWGLPDQPRYLNAVVEMTTTRDPDSLLDLCKNIETALGRIPAPRNHPRCIDIDILYFGSQERTSSTLRLPHPGLARRRFVLAPLAELLAERRAPVGDHPATLLAVCTDMGRVWKTAFRLEIPT